MRIRDVASVSVGAALRILGSGTFVNQSTVPLVVGGHFDNRSTRPECFDSANGTILLNGTAVQTFEVGGREINPGGNRGQTDFRIGTLEVASGANIAFQDAFDNDQLGQTACTEALYVGELILRSGSTIRIDNCRVYYDTLIQEPDVTITGQRCGELKDRCQVAAVPEPQRLSLPSNPINRKIRYLSFTAGDAGRSQAIRVTFQNVPAPYAHWNGAQLWVQEPKRYCENAGVNLAPNSAPPNYGCPAGPSGSGGLNPPWFWAADLGCDAYFDDWTTYGVVHVWNQGVIPLGVYDVQALDETCSPDIEANYSTALTMTQSRWGDLVVDCTTNPCGPPEGTVNVTTDVTALLDKWKNLPGNVSKARADIEGSPSGDHRLPDQAVNITDVTYCLGAFVGQTYPPPGFPSPGNPPSCEP